MLNIPSGLFDKYYEASDWFISSDFIGKRCTLVYPPIKEPCANCTVSMIGDSSTNTYRHGGPMPFDFGTCPLCGGNGLRETENTGTIRLRLYWNRKDWNKLVSNINVPSAEVMIIGFLSDLPKLRRANEIILISEQQYADLRFCLANEPFPHGFGKNRYFIAFLKRT